MREAELRLLELPVLQLAHKLGEVLPDAAQKLRHRVVRHTSDAEGVLNGAPELCVRHAELHFGLLAGLCRGDVGFEERLEVLVQDAFRVSAVTK